MTSLPGIAAYFVKTEFRLFREPFWGWSWAIGVRAHVEVGVNPDVSQESTLIFETFSQWDLRLANRAALASQGASVSTSSALGYKHVPPCLAFSLGARAVTRAFVLCEQHFTDRAISPDLGTSF